MQMQQRRQQPIPRFAPHGYGPQAYGYPRQNQGYPAPPPPPVRYSAPQFYGPPAGYQPRPGLDAGQQTIPPPPQPTSRAAEPQTRGQPQAPVPEPPPSPQTHRAPRNIRDDITADARSPFMLTSASPKAELDSYGSPLQLKPHQLAVLKRLQDVERNHHNTHKLGILKDKAGAGKTFCLLALIMQEKLASPHINRTNIIVVTNALAHQWAEAIDKFNTGAETPLSYSDFTDYASVASLYHGTLNQYTDIFITTNSFSDTIIQACEVARLAVDRIIFDECDTIEWSIHKDGVAGFTWFVSASFTQVPQAYVHRVANLTPLQMESCSVWCDRDFVDTVWQLPPMKVNKVKCTSTYVDVVLRPLLNDEQLQTVNAGDYHNLPFNMSNKNPRDDKEAVETIQESCRYQIALNEPIIEEVQTRVKSMMNNPERTALMDQVKSLKKLVKDQKNTLDVLQRGLDSVAHHVSSDKLKMVMKVLKEIKGKGYTIIYSKHIQPFEQLSEMLEDSGMKYRSIDVGTIEESNKILAQYKSGEIPVFLAHAGMFAAGVNLEVTTDIIFLHKMEALMEHQVLGRGQRYGRKGSLKAWFMLFDNEVDKNKVTKPIDDSSDNADRRPIIQAEPEGSPRVEN